MVTKTILDNGIKVLTEVVNEVYSASIGVWIDVGSQDENQVNNGVSHSLEHMLFKGTHKRTAHDIAQEIEDVGGSLGASTGKETTCFYGRVMGSEVHVAVDLLTDMLLNARLAEDDLDLEKQVIVEEIKMYQDDPEDLSHEILIEKIWPGHPLSRPITGTAETVLGMNSQMLRNHVDTFYKPENIIVSIAGNFDEIRTIDQLLQGLGALQGKVPPKVSEIPKTTPFKFIQNKDIEQAHTIIALPGINIKDERRYILSILDLCLGGNMSSRLFQEVREKRGLVYTINTFKESHKLSGLFGVYAASSPKHVEQVIELTSLEFERVKAEGLSEKEINRAKTQLKSEMFLALESMRYRASKNCYSELFYGRDVPIEEICRDIDAVTAEDIKKIAQEFLVSENLSMVIVGPKSQLKKEYALAC